MKTKDFDDMDREQYVKKVENIFKVVLDGSFDDSEIELSDEGLKKCLDGLSEHRYNPERLRTAVIRIIEFGVRLSLTFSESVDVRKHARGVFDGCFRTLQSKCNDYARKDDPFRNFRLVGQLEHRVCDVETGIIVRISDKVSRIINLVFLGTKRMVLDESVDDTVKDLINYCAILYVYVAFEAE